MKRQELEAVLFKNGIKNVSSILLDNSNKLKAKKINDNVIQLWISFSLENLIPRIKYHFDSNGEFVKKSIKLTIFPFLVYWFLPMIVLALIITKIHHDSLNKLKELWAIPFGLLAFILLIQFLGYFNLKRIVSKELGKLIT